MTYRPGDVVNGHVLGDDNQWHPLPPASAPAAAPAPVPPPPPSAFGPSSPVSDAGLGQPTTPLPQGVPSGSTWPQTYPSPYQNPSPGSAGGPGSTPRRPFYKRWWFWLTLVLIVLILLAVVVIGALRSIGNAINSVTSGTAGPVATRTIPRATNPPAPTQGPAQDPSTKGSVTSPGTARPPVGGVGTGRDGDVTFTVTGVDCTKTSVGTAPLTKKSSGVFCLIALKITNGGTADVDFNPFFQEATDTAGKTYSPDLAAVIFMPDTSDLADPIPPGASVEGVLPFDVPTGTVLRSIELHESFTSTGATITLP